MSEFLRLLERVLDNLPLVINPRSYSDIFKSCCLFFLLTFLVIAWKKELRNSMSKKISAFFVFVFIVLFLIFFPTEIRPRLSKFSNEKVGMIFSRFDGTDLSEKFGKSLPNEIFAQYFRQELRDLGYDSLITIRTISWTVKSEEEAERTKTKYNASAVFWGSILKLENKAEVLGGFNAGQISFGLERDIFRTIKVNFPLNTKVKYMLNLSDSGFNMDDFVHKSVRVLLPCATAGIWYSNPKSFVDLIMKYPDIDEWYKKVEFAPFLLYSAADAAERANLKKEAMDIYHISFIYFDTLNMRIKDKKTVYDLKASDIETFAASALWAEGDIAWALGDTNRALTSFKLATMVDSSLLFDINKDCSMKCGVLLESVELRGIKSSFWDFNENNSQ
jgi:hypothetical protein